MAERPPDAPSSSNPPDEVGALLRPATAESFEIRTNVPGATVELSFVPPRSAATTDTSKANADEAGVAEFLIPQASLSRTLRITARASATGYIAAERAAVSPVTRIELRPLPTGSRDILIRVLDPNGRPLPDATVDVTGGTSVTTDSRGQARAIVPGPGDHRLSIRHPRFVDRMLHLRPTDTVTEVMLECGEVLEGQIRVGDHGVEGVPVQAHGAATRTGPNGWFRLTGLPSRSVRLWITDDYVQDVRVGSGRPIVELPGSLLLVRTVDQRGRHLVGTRLITRVILKDGSDAGIGRPTGTDPVTVLRIQQPDVESVSIDALRPGHRPARWSSQGPIPVGQVVAVTLRLDETPTDDLVVWQIRAHRPVPTRQIDVTVLDEEGTSLRHQSARLMQDNTIRLALFPLPERAHSIELRARRHQPLSALAWTREDGPVPRHNTIVLPRGAWVILDEPTDAYAPWVLRLDHDSGRSLGMFFRSFRSQEVDDVVQGLNRPGRRISWSPLPPGQWKITHSKSGASVQVRITAADEYRIVSLR